MSTYPAGVERGNFRAASANALGLSSPNRLGNATINPRMTESVDSFRSDMAVI